MLEKEKDPSQNSINLPKNRVMTGMGNKYQPPIYVKIYLHIMGDFVNEESISAITE
uniref:Uncharacterized protein n=1 Tax=Neobacillus citreus TaxID=2833578 RepID=A0A942T279_9BACI